MKVRKLLSALLPRFARDQRGTPSIETVLLIALVALAVAPFLDDLGAVIGQVFQTLSDNLLGNIGQ
ncbi:Flp family type IVb pilin [Symbiobacterium terraclitae]|uniref:Flp family type IVb pilin n=1 Tax=Symbiobacterium terraclitae TaxID=557451 RepID=UPI0035B55828